MAAAKDMNIFIAKGRVYELMTGAFDLHIRPGRNGRLRSRRREAENTQPAAVQAASAGTGPATEIIANASTIITQTGREGQVRAATVSPRGRRRREDPDGTVATIVLGRQTDGPMDLRWNDEVEVRGHVVARSGYSRVWGGYTYQQDFVADEIRYSKTRIEAMTGIHDGFYTGPDNFEAYFQGIVADIREKDGFMNLTLEVRDNSGVAGRRPSEIRIQYSIKAKINREVNVEKGDEIGVIASLSTRQKGSGGEMRRFANLHAEDLIIIRKAVSSGDAEKEAEQMFAALDDDDFNDAEEAAVAVRSQDNAEVTEG